MVTSIHLNLVWKNVVECAHTQTETNEHTIECGLSPCKISKYLKKIKKLPL